MPPLKPADYLRRARELGAGRAADAPVTRLALLGSFTLDFLSPYLIVEADALGVALEPWAGPFGSLEQQIFESTSPLWQGPRDAVWLTLRIEDVEPELARDLPAQGAAVIVKRLDQLRERVVALVEGIRARSSAHVLVSNFAPPPTLDVFGASDPDGLVHLVAALNRELARALKAIPGAHVFDWAGVVAAHGAARFGDARLWYLARTPLAVEAQPVVARALVRSLRALLRPAAKCVVVDLDNTLWGGVLGDDGVEGIKLGDAFPGSAFKDVQRALVELKRRGFLLAIASKNDDALVKEALARHPEMVLRAGDFAAIEAHWEPKPESLRRIAAALHIGLDALVFLDDNPVERAAVRSALPMVEVVELPPEPWLVPSAIAQIAALDRPRLLEEDRARATMIAGDAHREEACRAASTVEDFLTGLGMVAEVGAIDALSLPRVHQLIHKTNQFNLTTRRHSADELGRLARSPEARAVWLRLGDRFGDLGLVCVGILRRVDGETWEIDTLLMSCRVMGRHVEEAFVHELLARAEAAGARRVRGVYRASARNHIVAGLYESVGFVPHSTSGDESHYEIDLQSAVRPSWPAFIRREEQA